MEADLKEAMEFGGLREALESMNRDGRDDRDRHSDYTKQKMIEYLAADGDAARSCTSEKIAKRGATSTGPSCATII